MDDDMSLIYNIQLCRICQIPGKTDLVSTSGSTENGENYLDSLKFIFCDIIWIEDELISLACKICIKRIQETAEFKRICLETNRRRGAGNFNPVKLEDIVSVKIEIPDIEGTKDSQDRYSGPEVKTLTLSHRRRKRKALLDDQSDLEDYNKRPKSKSKTKKKTYRPKVLKINKAKDRSKKIKELKSDSDYEDDFEVDANVNEDIENNGLDQNIVADANGDVKEENSKEAIRKMSQYVAQYKPSTNERSCRVCKRKFSSLQKLKEHIKNNHLKLRRYRCDVCHMGFIGRDALNRHMYKHNGTRNYICTICGRKYITQGDLTHHLERHADELKYACEICPDKKFKTYSSLRTHRIIVHTDPKDFKYLCTECGSKFPSSGGLKVHMLRHKNVRNFTCHMCDKSFCTKAEMQRHTATHSNMRPYKCDLCSAEYKHKNILLIHKTKRHGIGNYKFRTEKKFECSYCEKKIASKDKLDRHIRTHTGVKPYKCRLCDQKFICKSYIKGHMRGKHDVNVEAADYDTKLYYDVCVDSTPQNSTVITKTENNIEVMKSEVKE